jgi:hypothetical protein
MWTWLSIPVPLEKHASFKSDPILWDEPRDYAKREPDQSNG